MVQDQLEPLSPFDDSRLGLGTLEMAGNRSRTILGMTGDADSIPPQAFDPIHPVLRFHLDERAGRQPHAVDGLVGSHRSALPRFDESNRVAIGNPNHLITRL